MKKRLVFLVAIVMLFSSFMVGCSVDKPRNQTVDKITDNKIEELSIRKVQDMAGREHEVPEKIEKVFATGLSGTLFIYTFEEEKLCGITINLTEDEKKYTSKHFQSLPVLGATGGKGQAASPEEIINISPDIVITMGKLNEATKEEADKLQEQLNIPVIMLSDDIMKTAETYKYLGDIMNNKERGNELANYAEKIFEDIDEALSKIPEDKRVNVYYAGGQVGLETGLKGSVHVQSIELAGGINVAESSASEATKGRTEVSMEQVIKWDPELIIVSPSKSSGVKSSYDNIKTDKNWKNIKAVKESRVYETPYKPFNWFDRPPSVNRILGLKWLANIMYPEETNYDIKKEAKDFYDKFYHIQITDEDLDSILSNSL